MYALAILGMVSPKEPKISLNGWTPILERIDRYVSHMTPKREKRKKLETCHQHVVLHNHQGDSSTMAGRVKAKRG